jgi:hypothetical protein
MVTLEIDTRQIAKLQRTLSGIEKGVPKALVPAINRALARGKTVVKRQIRKEYLIKARDIPVEVKRANRATLAGAVIVQQGMLGLDKFKLRPKFNLNQWYAKQTGVRITPHAEPKRVKRRKMLFAQVKRGGGGVIPSAFYIPSGGPYKRISRHRHPIYKLKTIGAAIMASQPAVGPEVQKEMGDTLAKRIDHEMTRVLNRGYK